MSLQESEYNVLSRREEAYKFIFENSGKIIKAHIITYMEKNGFASLRTAHEIIQDFQKEKKIVYQPDRSNSKKHWVFINDKDKFGKIYEAISQIEKLVHNLTPLVTRDISIIKHVRNIGKKTDTRRLRDTYFRDLIHMAQLTIYGKITDIVTAIEKNIKSNDDRETLYLRLPAIMTVSNKLNEVIIPEVMSSLWFNQKQLIMVPGTTYYNIVTGITGLMSSNPT